MTDDGIDPRAVAAADVSGFVCWCAVAAFAVVWVPAICAFVAGMIQP